MQLSFSNFQFSPEKERKEINQTCDTNALSVFVSPKKKKNKQSILKINNNNN